MRANRGNTVLISAAVGVVFLAGLIVHGPVGGILLLLVAAALVLLTFGAWHGVRREGRPVRIVVVAAIVVLAVVKLAGRA